MPLLLLLLDPPEPAVITSVPVVLGQGPERRSGLEHVFPEVLDEAVVVLLLQEELQSAFGQRRPVHRIEELDDR